jgi:predicted kinase
MPTLNRRNPDRQYSRTYRSDEYKHTYDTVYNTQRWRNVRKQYLLRNPLCVDCLAEGKTNHATVLDHIIPISKGGDIWKHNNFQALCASHHNRKTMTTDRANQVADIVVVFGPPCSGKSTYIDNHANDKDYIIDTDRLALAILGKEAYKLRTRQQANIILNARDAMVRSMLKEEIKIWIPTTYIHAGVFKGLEYQLIHMDTTQHQCFEYLKASGREDHEQQRQIIQAWFDKQNNLNLLEQ